MDERVRRWALWGAILLLAGAIAAAYANSWKGPYIFDDAASIPENPTIQRLWPLSTVLAPPNGGETVSGRPVLNLSFALNYAAGQLEPRGYHIANEVIHILAALTLFGIVRRTVKGDRVGLALAVALLWGLHPLQTEAVTYTVQRAESLMGLFYLLTIYCFVRYASLSSPTSSECLGSGSRQGFRARSAVRSRKPWRLPLPIHRMRWDWMAVFFCMLGMATKEVMVSAPLIVFLYDVTFLTGSWRESWRRRWRMHLALASTWLLLAFLVLGSHGRGGTAGFGAWIPPKYYWVTQGPAIFRYFALSVWPHPLVFDYGFDRYWIHHLGAGAVAAAAVFALLGAALWLQWRPGRWRWLGFLGVVFFAILAPTSVIPGTRQTMAEHRLYLALAPLLILLGLGVDRLCRRQKWLGGAALLAAATAAGALTARRNRDYRSEVALWASTVKAAPENPYARSSYGSVLFTDGQTAAAVEQFRQAVTLFPDYSQARADLGAALIGVGKSAEGVAELRQAVQTGADDPKVHWVAANGLARLGNTAAANSEYAAAIRLQPYFPRALFDWGNLLIDEGDPAAAVERLRTAVGQQPANQDGHNSLAIAYAQLHREAEAEAEFRAAIRCNPAAAEPHNNLGNVLRNLGRMAEARAEYQTAIRLNPNYGDARDNLALLPP